VARVVAGLGIGAEFPVAFALLAEYSPKRLRHILVPVGPICYAVGWFCCALVSTWVIPAFGWRAIYWLGVTPALLIIYVRRFLPESVRFLLAHGRSKRRAPSPRTWHGAREWAMWSSCRRLRRGRKTNRARDSAPLTPSGRWKHRRRRVLLLRQQHPERGIQHLASLDLRAAGLHVDPELQVHHGHSGGDPPRQIFAMWLQDRMPRKWAMLLMAAASSAFFLAFGISFELKMPIEVTVAANVGYQFFSQGIIVILYTLGSELFRHGAQPRHGHRHGHGPGRVHPRAVRVGSS